MVRYDIVRNQQPNAFDRIAAAANLSGAAFKLYCYFETTYLYIRPYVIELLNISPKTVDKAFDELVEKKYLQKLSPLRYEFYVKIPS